MTLASGANSDYVGFCAPPPPHIQTTQEFEPSLTYQFMHTHIAMHANLHGYLIVLYPLTSRHTIIEYVMLRHGLRRKKIDASSWLLSKLC